MRLTTKGRFAVTAMLDLALRHQQGPVTLAGIGVRQRISLSYLEQLFGKLRRQALVESVRGPGGGYRLGRPTEKISIADIILAVDEPRETTLCRCMENCQEDKRCMTHNLWATLNEKLYDYLSSVTLKDLVDEQLAKEGNVAVLADRRPAAARKTVSLGA